MSNKANRDGNSENSIVVMRAFSSATDLVPQVVADVESMLPPPSREVIEWEEKYNDEWEALHNGDYQRFSQLLEQGKTFGWKDPTGRPAMVVAAYGGNVQILDALLKQGHGVDDADADGETPILAALMERKMDAVAFLKEQGANLAAENRYGVSFNSLSAKLK